MAYETAGSIISDAAAELGLGTVTDPFGSSDANVIQLRGLLKSGGRDLVRARDWTHLIKEFTIVTRPNWAASTLYASAATAWSAGAGFFSVGNPMANSGNLYRSTTQGVTSAFGAGPSGTGSSITDGTAVWEYLNGGSASIVVNGAYYYTCTAGGAGALSGTVGPYGSVVGVTELDGAATWTMSGNASDYALPSGFSGLIDQTGWNRTSQLPVGGPVDGQMWQYLKGRAQGVVFSVLFRPVAGVMRLYPDTDPPGGYQITFEYMSNYWTSATGGTAPTADAPTLNGDIIYFDSLLMVRRLKLDWLKAKGFDTTHAQRDYDEELEEVKNSDGASPVLNLQGRGPCDSLVSAQNVPWTGFGS